MDRRRFLKYAGATAAIIGASALGFDLLPAQMNRTAQTTTSSSLTAFSSVSTASSLSSTQLFEVRGSLFFDYNGNGKQDGEEPPVQNAQVQIYDGAKIIAESLTSSAGDYDVDIPAGYYRLCIKPDDTKPDRPRFRYMCTSPAEFTAIQDGYSLTVVGDGRFDVGLMEGFVTLPFSKGIPINIEDYFFHGNAPPRVYWDGRQLPGTGGHNPPWAHPEEDFLMSTGTVIRAAMPGKIQGVNYSPNESADNSEVYWIALFNDKYQYATTCLHIKEPLLPVGSVVSRGDSIAISGDTGTGSPGIPHTAFQVWKHRNDGDYSLDPYSPVAGVPKGAWIAGTWKWYASDEDWVSQGYWTKLNDPQYP